MRNARVWTSLSALHARYSARPACAIALLITMAVCAFVVLICLFADFSSAGDSFFATYRSLDVADGARVPRVDDHPRAGGDRRGAREARARVDLADGRPFTFFGLFVMIEFWGEIEPASYVAGAFSTLAVVCAFVLSFLAAPREAPAGGARRPVVAARRPRRRRPRAAPAPALLPAGRAGIPIRAAFTTSATGTGSAGRRRRARAAGEPVGGRPGSGRSRGRRRRCRRRARSPGGRWASVVRLPAVADGAQQARGTRSTPGRLSIDDRRRRPATAATCPVASSAVSVRRELDGIRSRRGEREQDGPCEADRLDDRRMSGSGSFELASALTTYSSRSTRTTALSVPRIEPARSRRLERLVRRRLRQLDARGARRETVA